MTKLEKFLGILILISLILKFALIPFGGVLFMISLAALTFIYYPFGFAFFNGIRLRQIFRKNSYKGISALKIIIAIGAGIGLTFTCTGILVKLQHLSVFDMSLIVGLGISSLMLMIALTGWTQSKSDFYKRILKRIAIIGGLVLITAIVPDLTITKIQFRNHPDYIKAYEAYLKNPDNEEIRDKMYNELNKATMSEKEFEEYMKHRNEK